MVSLLAGILVTERVRAQSGGHQDEGSKTSSDLLDRAGGPQRDAALKVILQLKGPMSGELRAFLNQRGVHVKSNFKNLNAQSVDMPASVLNAIANFDEVVFMSSDRQSASLGHLSATTGADAVRTTNGIKVSGLDGTGIGIAFLDSGIYGNHTDFQDKNNL